ncbi:uncharacterized protein LOC134240671 [Saccostrea cucullata]|uniref:uncharacterized protein LOC134240671 n=1 Tax=Saccostrea cuccullata TaxID=36930 RepID=UPI002ED3DD50
MSGNSRSRTTETREQITFSIINNFTILNTTEFKVTTTYTTPVISSQVRLILLSLSVAVVVFLTIIFLCWLFCRRRKEALTETYNHYSHVDQTEFVDFQQMSDMILTENIEYEMVTLPVSDVANSENVDSGFHQTDDKIGNLVAMDKFQKERIHLNGPQFSEPKGPLSLNRGDDFNIKTPPLDVHKNFEFSSKENANDDNYFTLEPVNVNVKEKSNGQVDGQNYFTIEPSQK